MTSKMKNFSMNKVLSSIKKKPTFSNAGSGSGNGNGDDATPDPTGDGPEAMATRCVKQFCTSDSGNSGDEVAFLPSIVEAAESSPAAAAECARLIRKYLHRDYWTKPSLQYNAIMLIRILADNPGATFTRNMDKKFADTIKELLRSGKDGNVRQMLMETLDAFENTKGYDENLQLLIEMWRREKEKAYRVYGHRFSPPPTQQYSPYLSHHQSLPNQQEYFQRAQHTPRLPDPVELANRLEEARTSAKLLEQVVACTPPQEILSNDLIKEFADRCTSASRSIQEYMSATDPAPDNDTMESLIDTNEQLQQSLNHHQRAVLNAKKQLGLGSPGSESVSRPGSVAPVVNEQSRPPPAAAGTSSSSRNEGVQDWLASSSAAASGSGNGSGSSRGKGKATATSSGDDWGLSDYKYESISSGPVAGGSSTAGVGPSRSHTGTPHRDEEDPFRDPIQPDSSASSVRRVQPSMLNTTDVGNPDARLSFEPYHPGFGSSGNNNGTSAGKSNNDNHSYTSSSAYDYMGFGGGSGTGAGAGNANNSIPGPVTPVSDDELYGSGDVHRSTGVQR